MGGTLVVTNDYPPRPGGIQAFVHELSARLPAGQVVVYASNWRGAARFDAAGDFPVVRSAGSLLAPTPATAAHAARLAAEHGCDRVLIGAAVPLGLLAPRLRRAGIDRIVALTHGHEAGLAAVPGGRTLLRRVAAGVDVLTYLGGYTRRRIAAALPPGIAARLVRLAPGVDTGTYRPGAGGERIRARYGLADRPVVVCVSRLVPRKGQDTLIRAWPRVLRVVPDAALLLVGGGPRRAALTRLVDACGLRNAVRLTGGIPWAELPAHYDAGDVFAMPCRTRLRGLDVEGLGIVYLEASATGLPVVAGDSGGAPDAVLPGETGQVVPGGDPIAVADRLIELLTDRAAARAMGAAGREWVTRAWSWDAAAARLRALLDGSGPDGLGSGGLGSGGLGER